MVPLSQRHRATQRRLAFSSRVVQDVGMGQPPRPIDAVTRGLAAGAIGTAAMTAAQTLYLRATGGEPSDTPAEVGQRIVEGVLQRGVPPERRPLLNTAMHWSYGMSWGAVYGIAAGSARSQPGVVAGGLTFGLAVWAASLMHLPAMKLAPPLWKQPPSAIAPDLGFHLVYGLGVAAGYRVLS
jgi:hypothetical protein